jgi:hypothetical protein
MLIVTPMMTRAANDKEQIAPAPAAMKALPDCFHPERVLADTGRFSGWNVKACDAAKIEPLNSVGREGHPPAWRGRFEEPAPSPESAIRIEQVRHTLKTCAGRATYALRKQTVEPVFGILKSALGFRQLLLRGLSNARNEWTLACLPGNFKRIATPHSKSARRA